MLPSGTVCETLGVVVEQELTEGGDAACVDVLYCEARSTMDSRLEPAAAVPVVVVLRSVVAVVVPGSLCGETLAIDRDAVEAIGVRCYVDTAGLDGRLTCAGQRDPGAHGHEHKEVVDFVPGDAAGVLGLQISAVVGLHRRHVDDDVRHRRGVGLVAVGRGVGRGGVGDDVSRGSGIGRRGGVVASDDEGGRKKCGQDLQLHGGLLGCHDEVVTVKSRRGRDKKKEGRIERR